MDAKSEQVVARMAAIESRFVGLFSAEELDSIRERVEATVNLSFALRAADVAVADEPSLYPPDQ